MCNLNEGKQKGCDNARMALAIHFPPFLLLGV
jgi:hypothetical protein